MPRTSSYAFTKRYPARVNTLTTAVTVSIGFDPQTTKSFPQPKQFVAIWDTGATNSVITKKVVRACGLKPIGMTQVHHAGGVSNREVFLVNIGLPSRRGFAHVRVTEGDMVGDADVLIGMDIIGEGDFAVTHKDGKTTFSFRVPSVGTIDFRRKKSPFRKIL
jgi:hypothetical protein